jgi:hypothetical protein
VIDFSSRSFAILLTNRVHPSRSWGSNNLARREWAGGLGQALRVRPAVGATAWFGGATNAATHTLTTLALPVPPRGARLGFDLFLDTEESDLLALERSTDGGTTWVAQPFTTRDRGEVTASEGTVSGTHDRRWLQARADLAPGAQLIRWRYTTDATNLGRGVYVDGIRVSSGDTVILDGERHPETLVADGWTLRSR